MIWFNKDKSLMINLDKVIYYRYKIISNIECLSINMGGQIVSLDSDEAVEIWELLKDKFDNK